MAKIIKFPTKKKNVLQLKLTIEESNPVIWRKILIPEDYLVDDLHCAIQIMFDWSDQYLYEFRIKGKRYAFDNKPDTLESYMYSLEELSLKKNNSFTYVYDFDDNWKIKILVEDILSLPENEKLPVYLDGENPAPPENIGGIYFYNEIFEKISKNEEVDPIFFENITENIEDFNREEIKNEFNELLWELEEFNENLESDISNYSEDSDLYDD